MQNIEIEIEDDDVNMNESSNKTSTEFKENEKKESIFIKKLKDSKKTSSKKPSDKKSKKSKKNINDDLTFIIPDINISKVENTHNVTEEILKTANSLESLKINNSLEKSLLTIKPKLPSLNFVTFSSHGENFVVSMYNSINNKFYPSSTNIPCFYDRHTFTTSPLGIPLKYHPHQFKVALSNDDINNIKKGAEPKETIINIKKELTIFEIKDGKKVGNRVDGLSYYKNLEKNGKGKVIEKNYFECDGIFCSFNCMLSYISEHYNNSYKQSCWLLPDLFKILFPNKSYMEYTNIKRSQPWRMLKLYGGSISIEDYRKNLVSVIESTKQFISYKPELFVECKQKMDYKDEIL